VNCNGLICTSAYTLRSWGTLTYTLSRGAIAVTLDCVLYSLAAPAATGCWGRRAGLAELSRSSINYLTTDHDHKPA
jgi:hypothetical protein